MSESLEAEILRFFDEPLDDRFEPLALKIFDYHDAKFALRKVLRISGNTMANRFLEEHSRPATAAFAVRTEIVSG
jgi:hypothetical protein